MLTNKPEIILASASPRREKLLREMGIRFTVVHPTGAEEMLAGRAPDTLAMVNAQRKARVVAGRHRSALVIGADTLVVLHTVIFGKPPDMKTAVETLGRLAGRQHEVLTGICVIHRELDVEVMFCDRTRVWMRPLTADQIAEYFRKVNPLDKAGAYAIQEHGDGVVERIEGSYSNVMGLPVERVRATLEKLGLAGHA
jgi:septum formation protein